VAAPTPTGRPAARHSGRPSASGWAGKPLRAAWLPASSPTCSVCRRRSGLSPALRRSPAWSWRSGCMRPVTRPQPTGALREP